MHTFRACHVYGTLHFININLTARRILIIHYENSTFGIIMSWSDRVASSRLTAAADPIVC